MDKSENRTIIPKLICLLLSLGLWLYISVVENPVRTYEIKNIPVELVNTDSLADSKFAIVDDKDFTVDLKLEGASSDVSKVKPEDFKIVADMSTYALKSGENTIPVQIISYPENITIKNNGFLGIKVQLEELITKEFTIQSKVKITYSDNIYEDELKITPSTVNVTGGKSTIDKINAAVISGDLKDVSKNTQNSYDIKLIDVEGNEVPNTQCNPKSASVVLTVENGKSVPINLKTTGTLKSDYEIESSELSQSYINIIGDKDVLDKIQYIDTNEVDISSLEGDQEVETKLNLPNGVSIKGGNNGIKVKFKIKTKQKEEVKVNKTINCTVHYNNLNDGFQIETSTPIIKVEASGTQEELDKLTDQDLSASLDLSSIKEEGTYKYKPEVAAANDKNITIENVEEVTVVIKKKEE